MKLGLWSTTAASNNSTAPDGWPEGQPPSTVNDCAREMMAAVRTFATDLQFFDHAMSPTFVGVSTFTVPGDQSSILHAGRRLKLLDGTTIYRTIATISASANTNVVLNTGTNLTASLSSFAVGVISNDNNGLPGRVSVSAIETQTISVSLIACTTATFTNIAGTNAIITNLSATHLDVASATITNCLLNSVSVTTALNVAGALSASAIVANVATVNTSIVNAGVYRGKNGTAGAPTIIYDAVDTDTGPFWLSDGTLAWACNSAEALRLSGGGLVCVAYTVTSDSRTKANWTPLPTDAVTALANMKAGSYTRIKDGERAVGIPAQDMELLFPECVHSQSNGIKLANYGPAAMASCVVLAAELVELRAELRSIKDKLK